MENNFTVNANSTELVKTLDADAILGIVSLIIVVLAIPIIILTLIILIAGPKKTTHESEHNSTLTTISADSNTETAKNSAPNSTSPTTFTSKNDDFYKEGIEIFISLLVYSIFLTYIGIYLIAYERKKTDLESPHNSTLSMISGINSTTNSTSPTLFT
ncbi:uncharacterized protein LOC110828461 [Zootermopsis nevadensis]|uniref:Uncharacterized protein n=1 Tax=Zootermopsis nevadensis TaxID=136037 RepID=A0A067RMW0_ZOONE|nr:uncharacterized protein LOC110828461 [Zootermopsis nevadensis]KDR21064.1 hypothetical protein L798_04120 [Zootermopsis nevadensis]